MLIRDMVRTKPISWLLFIVGSDIMMTYGINIAHHSHFVRAQDYPTIAKFVAMDLISFVFIMLFFDWLHHKFAQDGQETLIDIVLRIGGNLMAAYFGWFTIGFIVLQVIDFQAQTFWWLVVISAVLAVMNWLFRRVSPIKFQLNPSKNQ
ncbi:MULTISPECIES: hypothetical protein [Leuconostoc]|jgi:hypothetical protein|uniref:Tellurite resistance protein n=1 Tax=Leuconostoc pseudomesenteroides TaxID=33968 RepID=A0A5B8SXV5_LEUPS|nr:MULTISPECIES: hypothetical protein [Leuconostoc]MCC8440818.1 Tellurite resistance protein [Leuconostoc pseudomesenteroides]MCT4386643.1 Tellurite resistance protein [Leuconostoc pseudomesenteroides]MCT4404831.1 Tellurite resistance protein [Leuconostoc falkenbergense]MDG9733725.1 Tellurite resistance protein [Leuconostoc pseudomesenteroides]MDN2450787.1 Tellurite resistance protein [Leuconostoc sp. UCMA20149]